MDWQTVFLTVGGGAMALLIGWCAFLTGQLIQLRRDLSDYKLAATEKYASVGYLKDVEERLVRWLRDIDTKLDRALGMREAG